MSARPSISRKSQTISSKHPNRNGVGILKGKGPVLGKRFAAALGGVLIAAALLAAYGNHFHNAFHFDDGHTIENNAAIRQLRNIPLFFRDASTFSALPSNQSYRPLVSTLLAIDYHLGGKVEPFWFHVSVFALFVALTLLLVYFVYHLLATSGHSYANHWIAFLAVAWYGLHPANADTINYIIASSDIISTVGVLGSFAIYIGFPRLRRYYLYALPAAIGILAKPPAAIFPVLFAIFRLLFHETGKGRIGKARFHAWCKEVIPPFILCAAVLWFVQRMTPRTWVAGAGDAHNYLLTQPYVALLYFKTLFWPTGLSADYDLDPFTTLHDVHLWIGMMFLAIIATASIAACMAKRTRLIGFGLMWFLIALLPTSLFPLAEVMNDHRTFFPYIGLITAMAGLASLVIKSEDRPRVAVNILAGCSIFLFLFANGYATWHRNKVWETEDSLWRDVAAKGPGNPRGLMNYGTTLMAKGDYNGALDYFHRAYALSPRYPVLLINLAIAENAMKQSPQAEERFREALRLAPSAPDSYTYYARWLLGKGRMAEARSLLVQALKLSPRDINAQDLLAQTEDTTASQTPEAYLGLSLRYYSEGRYRESIDACRAALARRPEYAEAWNNIGAAYNKLGQFSKGAEACEQAIRLKPQFPLAQNNLQYARVMLKLGK